MSISCLICTDDLRSMAKIRNAVVFGCPDDVVLQENFLPPGGEGIPENHAHVVILDVDAPFERILGYVDSFRKKNAEAFVIVFVHYRAFSFSHDLMTLDHVEFLPKPVRSETVRDVMPRILEQIRQRKDDIMGRLKTVVNENIPVIRQHYLSLLMRKPVQDTETVKSKFATLQIDCPGPFYTVVIVDMPLEIDKPNYEAVSFLVLSSLKAALKAEGYQIYVFFDSGYRINCLIGHEEKLQNRSIGEIIEQVSSYCLLNMDVRLYYGIGSAGESAACIHTSYVQAEIDLNKNQNHPGYSDRSVNAAVQFIEDHLSDPKLDLETVSSHFGFSRTYFSRFFRRTHGEGFASYLRRARIDRARDLLTYTEEDIASVARQCGFSSVKYFFPVFRQATGMTPKQYRNSSAPAAKV